MWASVRGKPTASRELQVDEKREPLKSKDNKDLISEKGSRKRKIPGSHEKEAMPEKLVSPQPRTQVKPLLQRVVSASECPVEELSQAMSRLGLGLEREYAFDIFSSMMEKQSSYAFQGFELPRAVTAEMRALIVDWLVQVHEYLDLADDTLYLAVYLMNTYMKEGRVGASTLQLLATTCLFLACKLEEITYPEPAQLCLMAEDSFSQKDLLRMERKILACLRFELHYANPVHSLRLLAEVGLCSQEVQYLALYFLELSLMEVDCVRFEPAQLSLAALGLAQRLLCEAGFKGPDPLQELSAKLHTYSESELSVVHPYLAQAALRGPNSTCRATYLKYSQPQKLCSSTCPAIAASAYLRQCLGSPTP